MDPAEPVCQRSAARRDSLTKYLFGLSGCYDAFVAATVVRAAQARGDACHVAWFGTKEEYEVARSLGLPDVDATIAGPIDGDPLVAAHEFAADEWFGCEVALTIGCDEFAVALAQAMSNRDREVVRLGAGVRCNGDMQRGRMLADLAAEAWCAPNERTQQQLLLEGCSPGEIAIVGSLVAEALAHEQPALDSRQAPSFWVAFEHTGTPATAGGVEPLMTALHQAATATGLGLRAVPTVLREALADAEIDAHELFVDGLSAREQLEQARGATVILTDSVGWQEVAAALGVPCVAFPGAGGGVRADLLQTGHVTVAATADDFAAAVAGAAAGSRPDALPATDAAHQVLSAIDRWLAPVEATANAATLPTEANSTGRTFDHAELANVTEVLRSGTLNSTRGTFVHRFEREFAEWLGVKHAIACASGSAAVHGAIAALGLSPGDEVITTPITDMGALTPIWYEGAVPVFADVDPESLNVTAASITAQITERTRAIIVTHLFGKPADMDPILAMAAERGLPVIEDAAQAFGATLGGRAIGTLGKLSAFSLQQGKHITTGEGGIVCTDDDELARRVFLYVNKAWGYGDAKPDHYFPALNYRMTELQGAVAVGQLPKLGGVVRSRREIAAALRDGLSGLAGVELPMDPQDGTHSYWKFAFHVHSDAVPGGAIALGGRMRELGIACAPRYVQKPAFECQLFREWRDHPVSSLPLAANPRGSTKGPLFDRQGYPGAVRGLESVVVLPINERYQAEHVEIVVAAIRRAHGELVDG